MIKLLSSLLRHKIARITNRVGPDPLSYTVSVSYGCNSRCRTCNVWKKGADDLTLAEWDRVFSAIGTGPVWFTFSGGEPFLRDDLEGMVKSAYDRCRPRFINIPTNGILCDSIPEKVERISRSSPSSQVVINLSLDHFGAGHEMIRGVPGNWDLSMKTWEGLKRVQLNSPNLVLGIHTVISRFNVDEFETIYRRLIELKPDSYITEIAEERIELGTIGFGNAPSPEKYAAAIDFLISEMKKRPPKGTAKIAWALRLQYYALVKKWLKEKRQAMPCYAARLSCHISPDGDVWPCCIGAEVMGNMRRENYDLRKIWRSERARDLRAGIKGKGCSCPLANAHYTNMLEHWPTLARAGFDYFFG